MKKFNELSSKEKARAILKILDNLKDDSCMHSLIKVEKSYIQNLITYLNDNLLIKKLEKYLFKYIK